MNLWDHYRSQGSIKLFKKHEISLIGNPFDFLVYFSRVWRLSWRANIRLTYRLLRLTLLDNVYMLIYYSFFAIHCFSISFDLQSEMFCFSSSSIRNLFFDCSAGLVWRKVKGWADFTDFMSMCFFWFHGSWPSHMYLRGNKKSVWFALKQKKWHSSTLTHRRCLIIGWC